MLISWIPFYYEIKIALLVWLQYNNNAAYVYKTFIRPFLTRNEKMIDERISNLGRNALSGAKTVLEKSPQIIGSGVNLYNKISSPNTKTEENKSN